MIDRLAIIGCLLLLAGCAENSKNGIIEEIMSHREMAKEQGPPTESVVEPQPALSMPTDLTLPPPAAQAVDSTGVHTRVKSDVLAVPQSMAPEGEIQPNMDPYEAYGVSRYHDDGTLKSRTELKQDLRAAYLKRKRLTDPNYGTVMNLPNIFK